MLVTVPYFDQDVEPTLHAPLPPALVGHAIAAAAEGCAWSRRVLAADLPISLCWSVILAEVEPARAAALAHRAERVAALLASTGDAFALDPDVTSLGSVMPMTLGGDAGF